MARELFLRFDILVGDGQPSLVAAQVNVIARHFAEKCDQDIAPAKFSGRHLRFGRFHRAAFAAEYVNFPCRVEAGLIDVAIKRHAGRDRQ